MRSGLLMLVAVLALASLARGDETLVKRFDGHTTLTTADFAVPDGWEIRWHSDQVLSLGVIRRDNTVIAGTTGRNIGSLYLPQGGTYRIRVKGNDSIPWDVAVYALGKNGPAEADNDYYIPSAGPAFTPAPVTAQTNTPPPAAVPPAAATEAVAATPPAPPPIPTELSSDQLHCMVVIKGDRTQGTGFFLRLGKDKFIVTTQTLLAHNPNWKIFSSTGNPVQVTKIEGATDRDVALLSVRDFGYSALALGDPATVHAGDAVLTGKSDGTVFPSTDVIAVGPRRVEIDQLRAVPGCPVVLAKSGQVVGVIAVAPQVSETTVFADAGFDERDASVTGSIAAFAARLDNIPARETFDALKLQVQSQFLDGFHQHSRTLDAYLNGSGGGRDTRLWQSDDKIKTANDNFVQDVAGGEAGERTDALHTLLFELGLAADVDLSQAQLSSNFYSFTSLRAKDETAYRQTLKAQLDAYGSNLSSFGSVATKNNN